MERIELKAKAKEMIKGNLWYIWKPAVFFSICVFLITFIIALIIALLKVDENTMTILTVIMGTIESILVTTFIVGYSKYCIEFVRGNKLDWKEAINFGFSNFVTIIVVDILVALIIAGGFVLLIIPGIIFALGHSFYQEVCVDNIKLSPIEIISKSWQLTKGYKVEILFLGLSFLGWALLAPFTLGILYIWLIPYMTITFILAYEQLKKKAK